MADTTLTHGKSVPSVQEATTAEVRTAEVKTPAPSPVAPAVPAAGRRASFTLNTGRLALRGVRSLLAIALFLIAWEVAPRTGLVDRVFLPPFSEVLTALKDLAANGQLWEHTQASLVRSFAGFGIALAVSVPLGLVLGWYKPVAEFLNPLLEVFRNTAALALLPVFVLILGLGETSKISIVVYACAWPVLLNTIAGVKSVDPLLIKSARSLGLPAHRLFQKVILPAAVPTIFTGVRLAGAYSILILVAAEMVGAKAGLGFLINDSQFNFRIPDMYAGIVTISVIGLAVNYLLLRLERRFSTWRTNQ